MNEKDTRLADFLFEVGTMRKLPRMHRQTLLEDDMTDNIATHSYRVAFIGWILAQQEQVDAYKVVMMCLLHDLDEARSGDHNWIHKRYVKVYTNEIIDDQLGTLPFPFLAHIAREYEARETKESLVAKDADLLDQIFLLREYEVQGNKEAAAWLRNAEGDENNKIRQLMFPSSKAIARAVLARNPSDWWQNAWTSKRR